MAELRKLSYVKRHSHVAYLRDDGTGATSVDAGHSHELVAQTASPDQWEILPAGSGEGHTHVFVEFRPLRTPVDDEEKKVQEVIDLFKQLKKNEKECRKRAEEAERFVEGDQWPPDVKAALDASNRAALVLNHTASMIDLLSGYQRQNRTDLKFVPVEDSDSRVADILNTVVKQILESNNFAAEESAQFEDELIAGRGFIEVSEELNDDMQIEARINHVPWDAVYLGPHNKPDLSDLLVAIKTKWYTKPELLRLFPELEDKLPAAPTDAFERDFPAPTADDEPYTTAASSPNAGFDRISKADPDLVNLARDEYRVIECIRKEFTTVYIAVDPNSRGTDGPFTANLSMYAKSDVNQIKTIPGLMIVPRETHRMRVTRIVANVFIDDTYPDWSFNDFGLTVAYAYFRKGNWYGKVESAKDPQREINKRHSQAIDILNRCASYGWFFDANTFPTPELKRHFEDNASSPGFVQEVSNVEKPPRQQEGVKAPVEILNLEQLALDQFRAITNVNEELLGLQSNATSGVAILERKRQGMIGNERFFDALSMSKRRLGKLLIRVIQKHYSPERILRIIMSAARREEVLIGGQQVSPDSVQDMEAIRQLLETTDLTKFDVNVVESASSPSTMYANFQILTELAKQGLPISPATILQMAPIPNKQQVVAQTQQEMERQMQIEQGKQQAEIQKTVVAAQARQAGRNPAAPGGAA